MRKRLALIGMACAIGGVVLVTTWLADRPDEDGAPKIRVGYLSLASSLPFFVAEDKGYFKDEGVQVESFKLASSNEVADALLADRIDATSIAALSVWMAIEQRAPGTLKIFLMTYASEKTTVHRILVKRDSNIRALSGLKGKTIGTFPGLQMKVFTQLILQQYFNTDDLHIVPLSPPLQKDALLSGRIDALFCLEPVGTISEEAGVGEPIAINPLYEYILKPFPTAASAVSAKFATEQSEPLGRYVKAIYRAVDYISNNTEEARKLLPKYTSIQDNICQKVGIYDFWMVENMDSVAVQQLADLYTQHGILNSKLNTADMCLKLTD